MTLTAEHREEAFDTVRPWMDRKGWTGERIDAFDSLLDRFGIPRAPIVVTANRPRSGSISQAGIDLIHSFESCARSIGNNKFTAYPDPGSSNGIPWTIGWGSTGRGIGPGTVWTKAQCDERFAQDIERYADDVRRAIGGASTSQHQFDALVSFHYNTGAIASATLTRKHKAGDFAAASAQFARWVFNDGKRMRGLERRRAAEAALYRGE